MGIYLNPENDEYKRAITLRLIFASDITGSVLANGTRSLIICTLLKLAEG